MLPDRLKDFIRRSIFEMGVIEVKLLVEQYGAEKVSRALKVLDRIRQAQGLVYRYMYANCTQYRSTGYSNYMERDGYKNYYRLEEIA